MNRVRKWASFLHWEINADSFVSSSIAGSDGEDANFAPNLTEASRTVFIGTAAHLCVHRGFFGMTQVLEGMKDLEYDMYAILRGQRPCGKKVTSIQGQTDTDY